jgi:hypothetical protein
MDDLNLLYEFSRLIKRLRARMRVGALSRAPLEILRVELITNSKCVSCDWLIRPLDKWDEFQPAATQAKLQSQQALRDALAMRKLLFRLFPAARTTELCAYRVGPGGAHELVLAGTVQRGDDVPRSVASITMRAHLAGFRFVLVDGALCALPLDRARYAGDTYVAQAR